LVFRYYWSVVQICSFLVLIFRLEMELETQMYTMMKDMPSYRKRNNQVYFGNQLIQPSSQLDIEDLGKGYG
jgi:hypothetical protein